MAEGRFPGGQARLFQGLWTDPVTGIAYARARWYDPRNASWLSEDSFGDVDSSNLYAFVGWSPATGSDPLGLVTWSEVWAGTKSAAVTVGVGLGAVALGAAAVAVGVVSAPVVATAAVIAGVGLAANAAVDRFSAALDYQDQASVGEAIKLGLGDVTGVAPAMEAYAGVDLGTGRELSGEERWAKGGGAVGSLLTIGLAPKVARGTYGALNFDDVAAAEMREFAEGAQEAVRGMAPRFAGEMAPRAGPSNPAGRSAPRASSPIPESYMDPRNIVDMESARGLTGSTLNTSGEVRNANYFWRQLLQRRPEMFSKGNVYKIEELGISPKVDTTWVRHNPTHMSFPREGLHHHHINHGRFAVAVPRTIHQKWTSVLHPGS